MDFNNLKLSHESDKQELKMADEMIEDIQRKQHIEQLLMSAWVNQMNSIWSVHQHVVVIEIATLAALYFLVFSHDKAYQLEIIATLILIVNSLLYISLMIVRRHVQLLNSYFAPLKSGKIFPPIVRPSSLFPWPNSKKLRLTNHSLSRFTIFLTIILNFLLLSLVITTLINGLPNIYLTSVLLLNAVIPAWLLWKFEFKIISSESHM